jgi:hypothetical protein
LKRLLNLAAAAAGLTFLSLAGAVPAQAAPTVITDSGNITDGVDAFRLVLGDPQNGATPSEQPAGRREINWDGVPAGVTNTDAFPPAFFNLNSRRGAVTSTPGSGLRVSDNNFADVNPAYAVEFQSFSPAKTFAAVGSNVVEVTFQVAGETKAAGVSGFGVVFSDVDRPGTATMELFSGPLSLGTFEAPIRSDQDGQSFLGVVPDAGLLVTRVRITSGRGALGADVADVSAGGLLDLVVMDDFLYGEPHADSDADGLPDVGGEGDQRPASDVRTKVDVNGNAPGQTRVDNRVVPGGSTIQDLVNDARAKAQTPSQFRRFITELANALKRAGFLTAASKRELIRAARGQAA